MGRIRTRWIKNMGRELVKNNPGKFTADFENNKKAIDELGAIANKFTRNKVAGYIVTIVKQTQ